MDHLTRVTRAGYLPLTGIWIAAGLALLAGASPQPTAAQVAPRDQIEPALTYLASLDQYLLVWPEDRGSGHRLYARRIHANGNPVGSPSTGEYEATRTTDPSQPLGIQRDPSLIPGLLVYSELAPGATDYDIYAQRLFENGRPSGLPMLVAGGPGDQRHPDVVSAARGLGVEYLIVWSEDTRDQGDVMGLRVDYALRRSRGPAYPIAQGPGTAEDPTIQPDPLDAEQFLVLFTDDRNGNKDIFGARLAANGLPRGGPVGGIFPVIEAPEDDYAPLLLSGTELSGRREQARHLLVWTRDHPTDGPDLMGARLEQSGLPKGLPFVLAGGTGLQMTPAGARRGQDTSANRRLDPDEFLMVYMHDALGNFDLAGIRLSLLGQARTRAITVATD